MDPVVALSNSGKNGQKLSNDKIDRNKKNERLRKLRELHMKRNEACKLNHKEVIEENKRQQMPSNWTRKQEWAKRKLEENEEREQAEQQNLDYDMEKLRDIQADHAEQWERRRSSKKNPDKGFTSFEDAAARKYERMIKQIKPDMDEYHQLKQTIPDEQFYADKNSYVFGVHKDSKEAIDRLLNDMNKDYERQSKFSRRRTFDDDNDIDYINERNMKFNKKIERFYGKYTAEIKQNLERGTAV
ncbi:pre-mRNA-splicing factor syf2 [Dermatophagoides farinae]|uniref:Pre-mRNA-splicing factor SYF2 n=1 Tax=Dermatophagoides farinae TaxID=6954 RepID=A0A922KZ75_DERFA|nr:pre-mRNA-splicing factor syf2-like [Dermatophagoides farinae]KAH7643042.1 pre-mrna-splicing factor syf2-like protein [Dermatophagoides farinae]KAH9505838.1 pre-mRNA-splicing factor syf2 [Dermatophagoides farinae]